MDEIKQIHNFAVKWADKFSDKTINFSELFERNMADDCAELGFEMDCGHTFFEKYGNAAYDHEALEKVIDDIEDIPLLGSAIYSRWRYFNHWAYTGAEISEANNRIWFLLALIRLAVLTGGSPFGFQGTLKKVCIISNNICYGSPPEPYDEVEQHIIINAEGQVWFSGYNFGNVSGEYEEARNNNFSITKESAEKLMIAISHFFSNQYIKIYETDVGYWILEMTNTEDVTYKFRGSLYADIVWNGIDLSNLVRDTVGMNDLYVFDGNCKRI